MSKYYDDYKMSKVMVNTFNTFFEGNIEKKGECYKVGIYVYEMYVEFSTNVYIGDCPKLAELFDDIKTIQKACEKRKIEDVLSKSAFSAEESSKFTFISFLLALENCWIEERTTDVELIEMDSKL